MVVRNYGLIEKPLGILLLCIANHSDPYSTLFWLTPTSFRDSTNFTYPNRTSELSKSNAEGTHVSTAETARFPNQ